MASVATVVISELGSHGGRMASIAPASMVPIAVWKMALLIAAEDIYDPH
jgi:hypothetical protein